MEHIMKTYHLERPGSLDGLVVREGPIPEPGPGQALVRVKATALNFRDTYVLNGWIPGTKPDVVPLTDAAGEIISVGPDAGRFKVGDRVLNAFFANWAGGPFEVMPQQYTVELDGWLTEYKVVNVEALTAMPEHLSFEEGATLVCAGTTAWSALKGVQAGDTVLTLGSGGVSLFTIQIAKAMGARVIATTSTPEKAERLKALGADVTIDYRANPDWGEQARAETGGRGVDRVIEVGGAATMPQSIKAIALGGQVSLVGILAGIDGVVDYMAMFASQARYQAIPTGSRHDLEQAIRVFRQHQLHPVIDSSFAFDDAKAAMAHLSGGQPFGKIVIRH
jgi:NADPH:quinone reductase-like Zn-dependent oxidoreductase